MSSPARMALLVLIVLMRKQRGSVKAARLRRVSFGGALLTWSTSIIQNLTANSV